MSNDEFVNEHVVCYRHLKNRSSDEPFRYHAHCQKSKNKIRKIEEEAMISLKNDVNTYCDWLQFLAGD